jgi:dTDP-4-amino-4,6-dideoxygalactose transaminase
MHAVIDSVPFLDLATTYKKLESQWFAAIKQAGQSGSFVLGENVRAFEQELASYIGASHAVAVASGTDALILSLRAFGIGQGDEVITTPFTFFATAEAITLVGAKPVFVDIQPESFNIDPTAIKDRITERTKAVLPVHLYGYPADMTAITAIAKAHQLKVIEDCAQSFGAVSAEKRVGAIGDTGCFSFYPTKVLGAYGDGGMITTNDPAIVEHLQRLRNHGAVSPFIHREIGYNSRLDEVQAALLRIKLNTIGEAIQGRRKVAAAYKENLQDLGIGLPNEFAIGRHVFNLYTLRVKNRDRIRQALTENRIASAVCYPQPLHLQEVYRSFGYRTGELPHSERAAGEVLSLPIYPGMKSEHIERVCEVLHAAIAEKH